MRHVKLAVRMLLKTPLVTAVAVISLALGIGANAAIYSLFDQMLLRPLPVPEPTRLVNLGAPGPKPGSTQCSQAGDCEQVFSYPMFRDLERAQTVFTGIAAHKNFGANISVRNEPMTGQGLLVSGSYFGTLQLNAALGRLLTPEDDKVIGAHYVTVISYDFWQEKFGGDPKILGQSLLINGATFNIVGVAPRGFDGTTLGARPIIYVPITMRTALSRNFGDYEKRSSYWVYLFARLKPGVAIEQARVAVNGVYHPIINDVEAALQKGLSDQTMKRFKARSVIVEPGKQGQSSVPAEAKTPLLMLFSVTGVVLLIACANIANLLLARGANRAMEMGVRLALGATRAQLMTQLLTESVILSLAGGIASLLVARWTLSSIAALMPSEAAATLHFELQPSVVLFSALLAVVTGLLFGMFPALHSTRADLITVIRAGAGQMTGGRAASRFRSSLVTVQIALSMALLIAAGLFLKSLNNISRVDLGLNLDNVTTFAVSPGRNGYDSTRTAVLLNRAEEALAAIPGVTGVTSSLVPILSGDNWGTDVRVQGFQSGPDIDSNSRLNKIGAGYFKTLGVPMLAGREFTLSDQRGATRVAVVNEAFAKKFHMGTDVVGKFMGEDGNDSLNIQIVGLVKDAKYSEVKDVTPPLFFTPWRQDPRTSSMVFYVRSSLPPEQIVKLVPPVMKQLDATLPLEDVKTMSQQIRENIFLDRIISILSAAFALLATLLAGVGLYGVLSYSVAQRTREIGVRMALGADGARVRQMVLRQVSVMLFIGGAVGVAAALGVGRAAQSILYQLKGYDPVVFVLAVALLSIIALGAGFIPARRAALVDPMQALRYD